MAHQYQFLFYAIYAKKRVDTTIEGVEQKLVRGLTEKEIKTYIELTEKMRRNLEE